MGLSSGGAFNFSNGVVQGLGTIGLDDPYPDGAECQDGVVCTCTTNVEGGCQWMVLLCQMSGGTVYQDPDDDGIVVCSYIDND
jgi:hypothetical protein